MPKFFVFSDCHSYFNELKKALDEAGFDPNNENHWIVSCGDELDRGPQPLEVIKYLNSLKRKILIRGNHTLLFEDLCLRGYPEWHDKSNGTLDTVKILGGYKSDYEFDLCCERAYRKTKLYRDKMVNYFETKNYIFVHSWIAATNKDKMPAHYTRDRKFEFNPDWRNAGQKEWNVAMWGNPFDMVEKGLLPDKTLVFGHWHCSTAWAIEEGRSEFGADAKFDPYYGNGFIAIDACTAHTKRVNVIVIEDEFLEEYDK